MPDSMTVKMEGFKELEKKMKTLGPKIEKKVLRRALRAGAKVILQAAKGNTPVQTGDLKKSLVVRSGKSKKGIISIVVVTKAGFFKGKQFYGAFLEFGTKYLKPLGFIRRAYEKAREIALGVIVRELWDGIKRESVKK